MSELQNQLTQNGQEIQTGDVNNIAMGALMDDRLLAELLRMLPNQGSVSRCVLPYGWPNDNSGTITPTATNDGSVYVAPFRAVIGSRTNVNTDAVKGWRDIRSGWFVGGNDVSATTPATALAVKQAIAANASGSPRWDVIYAVVTPDANVTSVQRAVKNPTSGTVTTGSTVTQIGCTVSIGVAQGTPAGSPVFPNIPADGGGVYYIALANVLVPNGWTSASTCASWQINNVCQSTPSALSKSLGGANLSVPNLQLTAAQQQAWGAGTTTSISARPQWFLNQEMRGKEELIVPIDTIGSGAAWSHANLGLVDNSRDWRQRVFKTTIFAGFGGPTQTDYAWSRQNTGNTSKLIPGSAHDEATPEVMAGNVLVQFGQSFRLSASNWAGSPPSGYGVCWVTSANLSLLSAGIGLYVDTNGALRVYINGVANNARMFFWIEASGPMPSW